MNEERLHEALRALPVRDAAPATAMQVRAQALRAFDAAHGTPAARARHGLLRIWSRVGVPAMLFTFVCVYMSWALGIVAALYR